jgi:hypothetical protein
LKEVEKKLIALQMSLDENSLDRFAIIEALSFVQEAQKAVSKTQSTIGLLTQKTVPSSPTHQL